MSRVLTVSLGLMWLALGVWLDFQIRSAPADANLIILIVREAMMFPSEISLHLAALSLAAVLTLISGRVKTAAIVTALAAGSIIASLIKVFVVVYFANKIQMPIQRLDVLSIPMGIVYVHWTISFLIVCSAVILRRGVPSSSGPLASSKGVMG